MKHQKLHIFLLATITILGHGSALAQKRKKLEEQPPRLQGMEYRWCQPLTEKQIRQREKKGIGPRREIGKEEGQRKYDNRFGKWVFWDKDGKKMAEGRCDAKPSLKETTENGRWFYWDVDGQKIEMDWKQGKYNGLWTLYGATGKKVWQYQIQEGSPKQELFADENYLTSKNLRAQLPKSDSKEEK